jgi:uncharacterized SAM-binding protein YcdF (DUF218 family)
MSNQSQPVSQPASSDGPHATAGARPVRYAWWPALGTAAACGGLLVLAGFLLHGKPLAEKVLTTLAMPTGLLWLVLGGRLAQLAWCRAWQPLWAPLLLWCGLTVCATSPLVTFCIQSLERSVEAYHPERDPPLDLLIVLGGGTAQNSWRAQAACAGDRVVYAAQLYHQGAAQRLLTTGSATEGVSKSDTQPTEQTIEIWTRLAIPREAILTSPGRNTFEELKNIQAQWAQLPGQRIGLLTSALHLPRAVRLAKSAGLEVVPVAADVLASDKPFGLLDFIPSAGNLAQLTAVQRELMAALLGR